ncbi:MAG: peptidase S8 and S53 subtilisin kexin sedolisin [Mycobacterium sp.]|nr:MAG: peptidase S8 and S53 subtilisin kexin sedolisin [Mycobacterium sp.]
MTRGHQTSGTTEGWRWTPRSIAKGAGASLLVAAVVGSAALGVLGGKGSESKASTTTTAAPTAAKTGLLGGVLDSLLSTTNALTGFGTGFAEWNTSRNVLRSELNVVMGSAAVHATGVKGSGVDVALIDTGVAPVNHMNTDDALLNGPDLSLDYQAGMPASVDGFGHGTHLAGIIAGRDAGVAPEARIVNMKVGASDGAVDVSQVIASIDWVVAHRNDPGMNVRVINLAYGTDSTQSYKSSPLTHAVESAWRNGIVVVVSAGNTGGALVNPATDPFVITVGADDTNDPYNMFDDTVAPYSAVGTAARRVDLLAPGTSITSLRVPGGYADTKYPESRAVFGWYAKASGTSQAAAWTTGAVALLLDARPELTPDQVKAILKSTARPLAGVSADSQGAGVIDIFKAIAAPVPANATQTFTKSAGKGSIEDARGTAHLVADDGTELSGEIDVQGKAWAPATWAPLSTAGKAWNGGTWNGNVWAGSDYDSSTTVDGVEWSARTWRAETWTARTWRADMWAARTWRSETWKARTWRADGWV